MRKLLISSTAVTTLVVGTLLLVHLNATASTPLETFNSMRAAIAKAAHGGELTLSVTSTTGGTVTVSGKLDGEDLPPDFPIQTAVSRDGDTLDIHITLDMAPQNYSSIKFGKNQNTLELVPKAKPGEKILIGLDPTSMKPNSWTSMERRGTAWGIKERHAYTPKADSKPAKNAEMAVNARVLMHLGQSATVTVSGN